MDSMVFKKKTPLLVFFIPAFIFMALYLYYPFVMNIVNSFMKIDELGASASGVNSPVWENYALLFNDSKMATAFLNTMFLTLMTIIFQVGIAIILAILVDNIKKGQQFFRTVYFFPIVISATALGLLFNIIFLYDGGLVNNILLSLGLIKENIDWKSESNFMFTMLLPVMWQYVGFYFVILVTGLNNISEDIYEAAEIDGASGFRKVRFITLPLLRNTICTCLTLAITGSLKVFDMPYMMFPNGMPMDKSWLTGTYMYYQTFITKNVDYGSTIAIVIVVLGVVLSQVAGKIFKQKDY